MADATCAGCGLRLRRHRGDRRRRAARALTRTCPLGDAWFAERGAPARRSPASRAARRALDAALRRRGRDPRRRRGRRSSTASGRRACEAQRAGGRARRGDRRDRRSGRPARRRAGLAFQAIGASTATLRRDPRPRRGSSSCGGRTRRVTQPAPARAAAPGSRRRGRGRSSSSTRSARRPPRRPTRSSSSTPAQRLRGAVGAARARPRRAARSRPRGRPAARRARRPRRAPARLRHVAFLHGALGRARRARAVLARARPQPRSPRVTLALRGEGNAARRRGRPRLADRLPRGGELRPRPPAREPGELSAAALLERGEVDAALVVGSDPLEHLPAAAAERLRELPDRGRSTRATPRRRGRRASRSPPRPTASRSRAPRTAWTACRSRCARSRRTADAARRSTDVLAAIAGAAADAADRRRPRLRPRQRRRRRGARRLRAGRQDRRRRARRTRRSIDARGMVVMPGGVDIHAHIAGPKVNAARKLLPEEHRADVLDRTAIAALGHRRHRPLDVRHRLPLRAARLHDRRRGRRRRRSPPATRSPSCATRRSSTPLFLVLMGNNLAALRAHPRATRRACARRSPGGCRRPAATASSSSTPAASSCGSAATATSPRSTTTVAGVTPRQVIEAIATAVHELGLPHPVHVHCNNLGVAGNCAHDARHAAHARGPPRPPRPPAVPRLRRQAGRAAALAGAGARRVPQRAPGAQRRRRPGDVRPGDDDDRRRAGVRGPARHHPRQVGQRRHRGRDRLRDRAVHLPREELRPRAAVGHRPRAVPAQPRPVAARALDRPPQRRLVPQLPAPDPPADGPRVPQRADRAARTSRRSSAPCCSTTSTASTRSRRSRSSRAPGRRGCSGCATRATSASGADADVTIYDDRADREEMFAAPRYVIKDGRAVVRGRRAARGGSRADLLRVGAEYDPSIEPTLRGAVRGPLHACSSRAIRCASRGCSSPRARVAAQAGRDEAARRRDRRHVRRGVPDVGRARRDHRGDAGVGAARRARSMTGFATSVIGCKCEAGIERELDADETPDGRPGVSALLFAMDREGVGKRLVERVGQTRADLPDDRVLQRPGRRGRRSTSAASCATSATAIRPARCSTGGATGACR